MALQQTTTHGVSTSIEQTIAPSITNQITSRIISEETSEKTSDKTYEESIKDKINTFNINSYIYYFKEIINILTKEGRMFNTGILFLILSIIIYFFDST